jgi:hypothetical protein
MLRTITAAAIIALTATAVQAEETSLAARVHVAAVAACAPEASASLPASHYAFISQSCVARVSSATMAKLASDAKAKTLASTAALN